VRNDQPADEPVAERLIGTVPERAGHVPSECAPLHKYLANRYADIVVLTFGQIEDLLGFGLPESARTLREWWTTTDAHASPSPWSAAWLLAGRTATPNLPARTVAFERVVTP
jgi:hypothetical protein